jgi:diguanylate cyclase (GGDEF)-like protein
MSLSYDPWLVVLSILVAMLVSFTALRLAARVAESEQRAARVWLVMGATSMGVGIWAMHFIGMLAMSLPIRVTYDIGLTLASLVAAMLTCGFAIHIASRPRLSHARHVACSVVMAAGIVAMHYIGMSAIPITPAIDYDPWLVFESLVIALLACYAALGLTFRLRDDGTPLRIVARLAAAALMGLGIAGMHYTGMAAARFRVGAICSGGLAFDGRWLAVAVGLAALLLLSLALVTSVFDAHLAVRARWHAARLQKANEALNYQARHDALTALPNRTLFIERLRQALADASAEAPHIVVMLVDLDRFKSINDSLGHTAGDAVLKEMAGRLVSQLPESGLAARLGGDEFLLMAPISDPRQALQLAEGIVRRIADPYVLNGFELQVGASIGISTFPFDRSNPEVLISHADEAMYEAKRSGGNGLRFFVPGTTAYTAARLKLESELRHAAQLGQLRLHYQPQLHIASGRIIGLEALVRWQHPENGWIPPGDFIALAERSDAIEGIGRWVLEEACRQSQDWRERGIADIPIAVNVSAREFRQAGLVEQVRGAILAHGLEPRHIEIELTESLVMSDGDRSIEALEELHGAGFSIALDDFGTGYSSMSYLKRLPVAKLKIDRSFIIDLGSSTESDSIVKAVISLAHALGIIVIAEGVEDAWQVSALEAFGCDEYQGYFYSAPCDAAEIERLFARQASPQARDAMLAAAVLGVRL